MRTYWVLGSSNRAVERKLNIIWIVKNKFMLLIVIYKKIILNTLVVPLILQRKFFFLWKLINYIRYIAENPNVQRKHKGEFESCYLLHTMLQQKKKYKVKSLIFEVMNAFSVLKIGKKKSNNRELKILNMLKKVRNVNKFEV